MRRTLAIVTAILIALPGAAPSRAAEAPFEAGLLRLAEVLGSLHFLRNLCGESGNQWRAEMEQLLTSENPDAARRARFIARFNRGYRSFDNSYSTCTASAQEAIIRYMREGETLAQDIATQYGN